MSEQKLTKEVEEEIDAQKEAAIFEIDTKLNIGDLKEKSVIIFRMRKYNVGALEALKAIATRYGDELRGKNITMLVLANGDSIESLDEGDMNKQGWEKKDKKSIII